VQKEEMTTAMIKMKINPTHAKIRVDKIWEESAATATLDFAHYKDHVRRYESRMLDLFDAFDTSNTGGLSRDELEAGIRGGAPPGTTDREVQELMSAFGTRPDGSVTFNEFAQVMLPLAATEKKDFFAGNYGTVEMAVPLTTSRAQTFWAGMAAGIVSRTATAPMDRLRAKMAAGGKGSQGGTMAAFRAMYAEGGIRGMWTGNGANIVQVGPESALLFLLNDLLKPYVARITGGDPERQTVVEKFVCGSTAGATSMTLVCGSRV
jgi:solute carrier family 25 (mitochondrial phosphate transporter), member 23/24/25/41